jgi:hypothetical protein
MFCIQDMFNWSVEVGWDEFWFQGVQNMESKALFYELIPRLPEDEELCGGVIVGESSGMCSGPLSSNMSITIND